MTTKKISDQELKELRQNFTHFDRDSNGFIDREEFRAFLDALGADMSDEEMEVGLRVVDRDKNGKIEFNEFVRWWTDR